MVDVSQSGNGSMVGPIVWFRERRARRDADAARAVDDARMRARLNRQKIVTVRRVYQPSRRGTKVWVEDFETGQVGDAWFWHASVRAGETLLVSCSGGWGPHHQRNILYVGSNYLGSGVLLRFAPSDVRAARRHYSRTRG